MSILFIVLGIFAGLAQAGLLRRSASQQPSLWGLPLRMGLVAAVLVGAALAGHLLAAAAGWLVAFALSVILIARRWT